MSDTLITVIAIGLAAVLMFVFPLMMMSDKVDNAAQVSVQSATTEFVENIKNTGEITKENFEAFETKITSPNTYDIEIEVWVLDENPGKKSVQTNSKRIGENVYYVVYTSQIENELYRTGGTGRYPLKEGDIVTVRVKNSNTTMSQELSPLPSSDLSTISAEASGMVTVNAK